MQKPRESSADLISEIKKRWDELIDKGQMISLKPGQYLFYEKHQAVGAFLLCKGTISLTKQYDPTFHKQISSESQPILGMDFLMTGDVYCYSAIALNDAELCYLPKSELLKLLPPTS